MAVDHVSETQEFTKTWNDLKPPKTIYKHLQPPQKYQQPTQKYPHDQLTKNRITSQTTHRCLK